MKVACPHCQRYYSLDQEKTSIIYAQGTTVHCELCGKDSTVMVFASYPAPFVEDKKQCSSDQGGYSE